MKPRYILDANTVVAAIRGHPSVDAHLLTLDPDDWCVSAITQGDVEATLRDATEPFHLQASAVAFFEMAHVVPWDSDAARLFALLQRPAHDTAALAITDRMAAAHALLLQAVLVTPQPAQFDAVAGLVTENWMAVPFAAATGA